MPLRRSSLVVPLLVVTLACAVTPHVGNSVRRLSAPPEHWAAYFIYSDPSGAQVYSWEGVYMGQTSEEKGVGLVTSCSSNEIEMTVHLKKRGYKPTSMIGLCQEGKSSPDALGRSAGVNSFRFFSACVGLSAVVPISYRTRLPFAVSKISEWSWSED